MVHQSDCPKAYEFDSDRQIDVEWAGSDSNGVREVRLRVTCYNNPGLLKDMSEVFARNGVNINGVNTQTSSDGRATCFFEVSVKNTQHLAVTMAELQKVRGSPRSGSVDEELNLKLFF
ncbi:MAG: ACT domain-containing protein [Bdellovibrionales bacterium]